MVVAMESMVMGWMFAMVVIAPASRVGLVVVVVAVVKWDRESVQLDLLVVLNDDDDADADDLQMARRVQMVPIVVVDTCSLVVR